MESSQPIPIEVMEKNESRRSVIDNLMRCPLCGAINVASNEECFSCTWRGQFDHEPECIQEGIAALLWQGVEPRPLAAWKEAPLKGITGRFKELLARLFWPQRRI